MLPASLLLWQAWLLGSQRTPAGAGGREEGEATAGICYRGEDETGGGCLEEGTMEICVVRLSVSQPEWVVGSKGTPTRVGSWDNLLAFIKMAVLQKTGGKNPWMEEAIIVADLIKTEMQSHLTS